MVGDVVNDERRVAVAGKVGFAGAGDDGGVASGRGQAVRAVGGGIEGYIDVWREGSLAREERVGEAEGEECGEKGQGVHVGLEIGVV